MQVALNFPSLRRRRGLYGVRAILNGQAEGVKEERVQGPGGLEENNKVRPVADQLESERVNTCGLRAYILTYYVHMY